MKRLVLATLIALPLVAAPQPYYRELPLTRGELRGCMDRDIFLRDRLSVLEQEKRYNDRETEAIDREGRMLADERRRLDNSNVGAVADYNARSDAHNRRVADHNQRVSDMNARAAMHNREAADLSADCSSRPYYFRDPDSVRRDGTLR